MPVYGPAKAAVLWDVQNAVIEQLGHHRPYLRVRLQTSCDAPKDALGRRCAPVGDRRRRSVLQMLDGDTLTCRPLAHRGGKPDAIRLR